MSAPYTVTGVVIPDPLPSGPRVPPPSRLDIYDLKEKQPKQFTLFILSWAEIMKKDFQPKAASFQQIGGIHGMPYVPWLGDPDEARQTDRGPWLGYCNHGSILFPNWHRPYLMLLEQIISDVAHGIASEFADEQGVSDQEAKDWINAANELRFPFWDWTNPRTGELGIPDFFTTEEIKICGPNGKELTHANVLAFFRLNHSVDGFNNRWEGSNGVYPKQAARAYFREWDRTYRHPSSKVKTTGTYPWKQLMHSVLKDKNDKRRGTWANVTNDVAGAFVFPFDIPANQFANAWDQYSNTTFQSGHQNQAHPKEWEALGIWYVQLLPDEATIDLLRIPGDNDTAGFDPIFFLHHCNIDRLVAFWEHIYPDYVAGTEGYLNPDGRTRTPFTQALGTWKETNNQVVGDNSPLPPFRNAGYSYWTSRGAHSLLYDPSDQPDPVNWQNKYYTYPPIVYKGHKIEIDTDPKHPTPIAVRKIQRSYLQKHFHYNPIKARKESKPLASDIFTKPHPYTEGRKPPGHRTVENYRQFFVAVSLDPTFIKGSHVLVVSVKIPGKLHEADQPYEIGRVAVLSRGSSETCGNCQAQRAGGVRVRGIIMVPHQFVAELLDGAGRNNENTADEEVVEAIKLSLGAELDLPDGTVHSHLRSTVNEPEPESESEPSLSSDRTPYLELLSCDVYQQVDEGSSEQTDLPYEFEDWKTHGALHKIVKGHRTAERHWGFPGQ
ncbi:hypothetical protein RSAG8_13613, partial [Rhizoctonia solani AG-8 WAC10335]